MKLFTAVILLNLLLAPCISRPLFSPYQRQSTAFYKCYYSQTGIDNIILGIDNTNDKVDEQDYQNMQNALNAGLKVDVVITPRHIGNADKEIEFLVKNNFNVVSRFWLAYFPGIRSSNQERNFQDFCTYVLELTKRMRETFNVEVGIVANIGLWEFLFDDITYCPQLANESPLFWIIEDLDNQPNFDSFEPFSGWKIPYAKSYREV